MTIRYADMLFVAVSESHFPLTFAVTMNLINSDERAVMCEQHRQYTYNVTLRRVRVAIFVVEKQCVLHMCVGVGGLVWVHGRDIVFARV